MSKITIATILNRAADRHLWSGQEERWREQQRTEYALNEFSCCAIDDAIHEANLSDQDRIDMVKRIFQAVRDLGVVTGSMRQFDEFSCCADRQAARYARLKLVAQLAKEQGV